MSRHQSEPDPSPVHGERFYSGNQMIGMVPVRGAAANCIRPLLPVIIALSLYWLSTTELIPAV